MTEKTPRIKGIFSKRDKRRIGAGTTSGISESVTFWFASEGEDGMVAVQALNDTFKPVGEIHPVPREQFLKQYVLEPELWYRNVSQRLTLGDFYREHNKFQQAQAEYKNVLAIDTDNIRANFGLGITYLALDHLDKAEYVFEKIVGMEETFLPQHKHLFNDFGIAMRKKKLFELAVKYYQRALVLTRNDENLHVNCARAFFELGEIESAYDSLRKALNINPDHSESLAFVDFLWKRNHKPEDDDMKDFIITALRRKAALDSFKDL